MNYKLSFIIIIFIFGFFFIYSTNNPQLSQSFNSTIENFDDDNTSASNESSDSNSVINKVPSNCPDVLIQKGKVFYLYNSKRVKVPGVNPIKFDDLEEYTEFLEWQRSQGITCPILFLQHAYDIQGESVYKNHPSPDNISSGAPEALIQLSDTLSKMVPPPNYNTVLPPNILPIHSLDVIRDMNINNNINLSNDIKANNPMTNGSIKPMYPSYDPQNQEIGIDTPMDKIFNEKTRVSPNPMDTNWGGVKYTDAAINSGMYSENEIYK